MKFPATATKKDILKTFEHLGFVVIREGNHIIMERRNYDNTITPLVLPNHKTIKRGTLRAVLTQAGIERADFIDAYSKI